MKTEEQKLQKYRESNEDIVFGKNWFKKHQRKLFWLLNTPIVKYWFRWVMRIHKYDCPINTKINYITPNSFYYNIKTIGNKTELTTDFRTHDKFSKRLYYAFKPFWYFLHFFDWVMLERIESLTKLSFGFDTLTQYPATTSAHNPYDGAFQSWGADNKSWAQIIAGASLAAGYAEDGYDTLLISASATTDKWNALNRAIYNFDTSALTSGATISACILSLKGFGKQDNATAITPDLDIYTATPTSTSTIASSDWGNVGGTSQTGSPITYAGWSTSAYNDFTFSVLTNISKTGISSFCTRNANYDVAASAPTWSNSGQHFLRAYYSDQAGTTSDPKLVVTYTVPATSDKMFLLF